jgi:antitoxin component YwqK of YwqJK toxin-antitoxin module
MSAIQEEPTCYICMEEAEPTNPFLKRAMCPCSGKATSSLQVHQLCLELARDRTGNCNVCKKQLDDNWAFDETFERSRTGYSYATWKFTQYAEDEKHGAAYTLKGRQNDYYGPLRYLAERFNYVAGKQHGLQIMYSEDGVVLDEGSFVQGTRHGRSVKRNDKGVITWEANYDDGQLHGPLKELFYGIMLNGSYEHDVKVGEHLEIVPDRTKYVQRVNYIGGKMNGALVQFHVDCGEAMPIRRTEYRDDMKHGLEQTWYLNVHDLKSSLAFEGSFVLDLPNGLHINYIYGTEKKANESYYIMGAKHGVQRIYDYVGELQTEITYEMDVLHGQVREFRAGKLIMDASYNRGFRHGLHIVGAKTATYWSDGTKQLLHGPFTKKLRDGATLTGSYKMSVRHGIFKKTDSSGAIVWQLSFRDGLLDGKCFVFNKARGMMRAGIPVGRHVLLYDDYSLAEEVNYDNEGRLHGACIYTNTMGNMDQRLTFKHGVLHGRQSFHDEAGRLALVIMMRDGLVHGRITRHDERGVATEELVKQSVLDDYIGQYKLRSPSAMGYNNYYEQRFMDSDGTVSECSGKANCCCGCNASYQDEYYCGCSACIKRCYGDYSRERFSSYDSY